MWDLSCENDQDSLALYVASGKYVASGCHRSIVDSLCPYAVSNGGP